MIYAQTQLKHYYMKDQSKHTGYGINIFLVGTLRTNRGGLLITWKSAFLVTMFRMTRFSDAIDLFFITTKSDFQYMF
jgi:hypothetical protein